MERILDPFVGVATSLLSAQLQYRGENELELIGVERNPFTAFVARTKIGWDHFSQLKIQRRIPNLIRRLSSKPKTKYEVGSLSTLRDVRAFDAQVMQELLFAREVLKEELGDSKEYSFFKLGWAACIEAASNVRKDGRALRFVQKDRRPPLRQLLEEKWLQMLGDLKATRIEMSKVKRGRVIARVLEGDGRTLDVVDGDDSSFDLILYSPPYLNNLDYSEVYKLELWLTEAVTTHQEFRSLRSMTFRSHPSYKFEETTFVDKMSRRSWPRQLRDSLLDVLPIDHYLEARRRTIRGYMDDMFQSLQNQFRLVRPGGFVVCVVGNSLHGNKDYPIPIPTDLLIASLARASGFKIKKVQATRHTNRRKHIAAGSRESVIILQRP